MLQYIRIVLLNLAKCSTDFFILPMEFFKGSARFRVLLRQFVERLVQGFQQIADFLDLLTLASGGGL